MTRDTARPDTVPNVAVQQASDTVCLIGLGYVGLPLAIAFDDVGFEVLGYDIDATRVDALRSDRDPTTTVGDDAIEASDVTFTTEAAAIEQADQVIIAVPTPVTEDDDPDLSYIEGAARTVGAQLTPDTTVVLESTVYPGLTAEVLVPELEAASGLTAGEEFHVGYSPERATAGDTDHGLNEVVKVVSAFDESVLDELEALYSSIIDAGVYRAPSVETAEAAKVIENIQRDVNIALMNEVSMALDPMDIDTQAVLETASTKWNFHEYEPGLVGGHCIPVDPYYFIDRVEEHGFSPELIKSSRRVNTDVISHIVDLTREGIASVGNTLEDSRILVLGVTYKPDVADVRAGAVGEVISDLSAEGATLVAHDPLADDRVIEDQFGVETTSRPTFQDFDAVVVLTPHSAFDTLDPADVAFRMPDDPVVIDVQGLFDREAVEHLPMTYKSL